MATGIFPLEISAIQAIIPSPFLDPPYHWIILPEKEL